MSVKRCHIELDPDYEDVSEIQNKKRKKFEEGGKCKFWIYWQTVIIASGHLQKEKKKYADQDDFAVKI